VLCFTYTTITSELHQAQYRVSKLLEHGDTDVDAPDRAGRKRYTKNSYDASDPKRGRKRDPPKPQGLRRGLSGRGSTTIPRGGGRGGRGAGAGRRGTFSTSRGRGRDALGPKAPRQTISRTSKERSERESEAYAAGEFSGAEGGRLSSCWESTSHRRVRRDSEDSRGNQHGILGMAGGVGKNAANETNERMDYGTGDEDDDDDGNNGHNNYNRRYENDDECSDGSSVGESTVPASDQGKPARYCSYFIR
jgi:hypothetical protein